MDPLTALVACLALLAVKGGEAFAAEFGKDLYSRVRRLRERTVESSADGEAASSNLANLDSRNLNPNTVAVLTGALERDPSLAEDAVALAELIQRRDPQFQVEQVIVDAENVTGIAGRPGRGSAEVRQWIRGSKGVTGMDLT